MQGTQRTEEYLQLRELIYSIREKVTIDEFNKMKNCLIDIEEYIKFTDEQIDQIYHSFYKLQNEVDRIKNEK
jgi:hypothetical protein